MLGSRGPAENSPEVVQAQLAAFSHALVNTKGKVQSVDKSLAHLAQKLEQETQLRQQLEVRFEELERTNACDSARTSDLNAHTDELATVVGDIKAWRQGLEDELKLKHEQLANAQQELAAELQQTFDGLRASSGRSGTITQWDEISGISMDLDAITKRFDRLELHCKGLDNLVRHGADIVKEPSSEGSGVSTFVTDLAHRCDKMNESIVRLLAEVPELSERSLRHTLSIEQLAGQRLELMDEGAVGRAAAELGFARLGADMQQERTQHGEAMKAMEEIVRLSHGKAEAMKAMEEIVRLSEEQRGGGMMKANEEMVRLTALVMEMDKEVGAIKESHTNFSEQLAKRSIQTQEVLSSQGMGELEHPPVEQKIQRNVTWEGNESHIASKGSPGSSEYIADEVLSWRTPRQLEDSLATGGAGLKGLDVSHALELRDLLSVVTERTSGLEELCQGFRTDMADIFGILEALDSSQLNRVQGRLENFSKELQLERKERESETELLRCIVQSLEGQVVACAATQAPRPGPRRGGETQRTHLGLPARQPDPARDSLNLARVAPAAEQIAVFRTDVRQLSPDSSRPSSRIQVTRDISPPKMSAIMRRDPLHSGPAPTVPVQCSQPISPVQSSRGIPAAAASYRPSASASIRILSSSPSPPAVNHRVLLSSTPSHVPAPSPIAVDIAFGAVRL